MGTTAARSGGASRRRLLAVSVVLGSFPAVAAAYPDRPVRMIVAYSAGGTGDLVGRVVAEGLSSRLGVPVLIENQGGGGRHPQGT